MCCELIERQLGRYVDGELSEAQRKTVEAHLRSCSSCRAELAELRELVDGIAQPDSAVYRDGSGPGSLWEGIERRLDQQESGAVRQRPVRRLRLRGGPWAIAAAVVLAVGLGLFGLSAIDSTAQAATLDFGVLLDALPLNPHKAFQKFLARYDGKPTTPLAARRSASHLNFDTPETLPGGFTLQSVYELRIGSAMAIAASYDREGEFLAAVFHPPMKHQRYGARENFPCVIGKKCGHKVQVGEWKLIHLTDPTTCHCLLSRLDEQAEIPQVMAAIAPKLPESEPKESHRQP